MIIKAIKLPNISIIMPTYSSQCKKCDKNYTYIAPISKCTTAMPDCCGSQTTKTITTMSMGSINATTAREFKAYECPVTGDVVTNPRTKKNIEAEHDLIIKEPGMFKPRKKEEIEDIPEALKPELERELAKVNS